MPNKPLTLTSTLKAMTTLNVDFLKRGPPVSALVLLYVLYFETNNFNKILQRVFDYFCLLCMLVCYKYVLTIVGIHICLYTVSHVCITCSNDLICVYLDTSR